MSPPAGGLTPTTVSAALLRHRSRPGLAISHPRGSWTWSELRDRVDEAAASMASLPRGARVCVDTEDALAAVPPLLAAEVSGVCVVPLAAGLVAAERARRLEQARAHRGPSPGVLVYTSGTTGEARGVRLPYGALTDSALRVAAATGLEAGDAWLGVLPLSHVGGLGALLRCLLRGATLVLRDRFDATETAELLASGAVTHGSFVARMLERTLDAGTVPWSGAVRFLMVGGGPTAPAVLARAREAGLPVFATYGMTEAGSTVTLERPGGPLVPPSAGRPLDGVAVRIAADGVVEVQTPSALEGYDPPHESPLRAGWVRTQDLGALLPDGRLVILDRRSDLIVTGGENVAPAAVEAVLAEDPDVDEVAVVGVSDASWGQRVVAVVRLRAGAPGTDAIAARSRDRLAPHERPKDWVVAADPLPRDGVGKLRRSEVRALLDARARAVGVSPSASS